MEQLPIVGDIGQPLKSAPEYLDAGLAIAFSPEEAAQRRNPAHGLTQGGRMFRQGQRGGNLPYRLCPSCSWSATVHGTLSSSRA